MGHIYFKCPAIFMTQFPVVGQLLCGGIFSHGRGRSWQQDCEFVVKVCCETVTAMAMNGDQVCGLKGDMSEQQSTSPIVNGKAAASTPVKSDSNADAHFITPTQNGTSRRTPTETYSFTAEPTIEDIRRMQAEFTDERNWNQFHQPRNLLLALVGEVGEVAELFQWRGEAAEGLPDWTGPEREHLAHELSDVLIYLVELAEKCHIDLPQAVLRKMALNRLKYPASKVHGSAKKYTEYND